jgi:hypothetical protein
VLLSLSTGEIMNPFKFTIGPINPCKLAPWDCLGETEAAGTVQAEFAVFWEMFTDTFTLGDEIRAEREAMVP